VKREIELVALVIGILVATAAAKCKCDKATVCVTDSQMTEYVQHVEMEPDRIGFHTNASGIAVFEVVFDTDGRVLDAKAVSGHALAIPLLMASVPRWRFLPYLRNGVAQKACGTLRLKFSIVENVSDVQVERGKQRTSRVRIPTYLAKSMTQRTFLPRDVGISGDVVLEMLVEKDGRVLDVRGVSGDSRLVNAARPAMTKWVFNPFFLDGEPVQFLTELTVQFDGKRRSAKLKPESAPLTTRSSEPR
jgi:N-acyl-L-homoserine lactone synthetase